MEVLLLILIIIVLLGGFKMSFHPNKREEKTGGYSETPYTEYEDGPQETTQDFKDKVDALSSLTLQQLRREHLKYLNAMVVTLDKPHKPIKPALIEEERLYFKEIVLEFRRRRS